MKSDGGIVTSNSVFKSYRCWHVCLDCGTLYELSMLVSDVTDWDRMLRCGKCQVKYIESSRS